MGKFDELYGYIVKLLWAYIVNTFCFASIAQGNCEIVFILLRIITQYITNAYA